MLCFCVTVHDFIILINVERQKCPSLGLLFASLTKVKFIYCSIHIILKIQQTTWVWQNSKYSLNFVLKVQNKLDRFYVSYISA